MSNPPMHSQEEEAQAQAWLRGYREGFIAAEKDARNQRRRIRAAQASVRAELEHLIETSDCVPECPHWEDESAEHDPDTCLRGSFVWMLEAIDNATRTTKRKRGDR